MHFPSPSLERLHQHLSHNSEVVTDLDRITAGCMFFGLCKHKSRGRITAACWWFWGQLEYRAAPLLSLLDRFFDLTPAALHHRWQGLRKYRYNGNAYAREALQRGAALVVMDQGRFADPRVVRVRNAREALYRLAREHRLRHRATVIAITGSCGKTTTKEFVAWLLASRFKVLATPGSFNTFEGLYLTLLRITPETDAVVLEISADGGNQVEEKARIACPDIGIITVIGKAHLQGFGDLDGVRAVKRKLFDVVMERRGQLIVNQDNPEIVALAENYPNVRRFGHGGDVDVRGHALAGATPLTLTWQPRGGEQHTVTTQLFGAYNADNLLAAVTVACELGVPAADIDRALASYRPDNMRSQLLQSGDVTIILDAYNANPTSVAVALRDFCEMVKGHRTLILGDMLELGRHSEAEHKAVLATIRRLPLDAVYLVGKEFGDVVGDPSISWYANAADLIQHLQQHPLRNTTVLIKASRGVALERVLTLWPDHGGHLQDQGPVRSGYAEGSPPHQAVS